VSGVRGAVGIVLAGGRSSRLPVADVPAGGKAALELVGRTFLERIVATVAAEVDHVIVVAAPGQLVPPLSVAAEIVRDSAPGAGPLAGLRDALAGASRRRPEIRTAFVCACDVPLLRRAVVRLLVGRGLAGTADWVVPEADGHPQVLLSAVAPALLPRIEAYLATGRRDLRGLLAALEAEAPRRVERVTTAEIAALDPTGDSMLDVDTPTDFARLLRRGIPPSAP
jgi:molybdopterin-guanine dinucleotide biosynthesis protein A